MQTREHQLKLFSCRAAMDFARKVVDEINKLEDPYVHDIQLGQLEVTQFSDGEFQPSFAESVRGAT